MRINDWSSDVCSSDLRRAAAPSRSARAHGHAVHRAGIVAVLRLLAGRIRHLAVRHHRRRRRQPEATAGRTARAAQRTALLARPADRSEEHKSEVQSLMRIVYAVFSMKKTKAHDTNENNTD